MLCFIIHHLGWQARKRFLGYLFEMTLFARVVCCRMVFLEPSAFVGTNPTAEPITSGLPV